MKPKYLLTAVAIVATAQAGFAQYSQDALRFSQTQTGNTSRIKAIGNAGTAIGGDLSSVGGNPAGIAFFTRSEISLTPEFNGSKVGSTYMNNKMDNNQGSLNLANVAAVIYSQLNSPKGTNKGQGWLSFNFGISYNRTANYYENIDYGGINKNNSITDYYAADANNNKYNNTPGDLDDRSLGRWAYDQNLIDYYAGDVYKSNATNPVERPTGSGTFVNINPNGYNQLSSATRTGGQSELSLAAGANYSNRLYLGVGLGISNIRYNTTTRFTEDGIANIYTNAGPPAVYADQRYNNVFTQDQQTTGTGINLKAGFIFKPVNAVRIGATVTSPTWYTVDDSYSEELSTRLNGRSQYIPSYNYPLKYDLKTPFKASGGIAFFLGQYGFITGDVEYVDYASIRLKTNPDYNASRDNSDIRTLYKSTVNARFGAEARLTNEFFLRGGYSMQGTPLKTNGSDIKTTSGGLGYRAGDYYFDVTYSRMDFGTSTVYPYEIGTASPSAALNKTIDNVYMTFGFRF